MFLPAFERYVALMETARDVVASKGAKGRDKLRNVLRTYIGISSGAEGRLGCMVVGTAVEAQRLDDEIAGRVKAVMARNENGSPSSCGSGRRTSRSLRRST